MTALEHSNPEWTRESYRPTSMRTALNGIMLSVDVPPSLEVLDALRDARAAATPEEVPRRRMAAAIRAEAELRREAADEKRKAKDCGWL